MNARTRSRPWAAVPLLVFGILSGCCEFLRLEAEALEGQYSQCESDEQCTLYRYFDDGYTSDEQPGLGNSCVPTFQCAVALSGDHAEFTEQAKQISDRYAASCATCMSASCGPAGVPYCDVISGRCVLGGHGERMSVSIDVQPPALQFGQLQPGMSLTSVLDMQSTGYDTLYLEDFRIQDLAPFDHEPFTIDFEQTERILAPGARSSLRVTCRPTEDGSFAGLLLILTNASPDRAVQIPLVCRAG